VDLLRRTSWDALAAFAEFAETRNFTRAAERLHLSQPALHTKIANLASGLGVTLYQRRGRDIELTDAGRKVQRFAHELTRTAAEFATELSVSATAQPVVLAAGEGAYLYLLGSGLRAFRAASRHPLRLDTLPAAGAVDAVSSARAQIGVAALERVPRALAVEPLTRVGQLIAVPTRHPLARQRQVRLRDLRGIPLILPPEGRPHRSMVSQALQSADVECAPVLEATGWELMLHFVQLGFGTAVVNACCRLPAGVVGRPLPELPHIQYHLFHARKALSPAAASLRDHLLRTADDWRSTGK
jgi:LysR family transcriptional regulator, low CO2-responsive transcriptional regulator